MPQSLESPDQLVRWLALCGLDMPGSALDLIHAASEDLRSRPALRNMLDATPDTFLRWWYAQDYLDWHLTRVTGNSDWAWLALARAGAAVSDSRFGTL